MTTGLIFFFGVIALILLERGAVRIRRMLGRLIEGQRELQDQVRRMEEAQGRLFHDLAGMRREIDRMATPTGTPGLDRSPGDEGEDLEALEKSAATGDVAAQDRLARFYAEGERKDPVTALMWFTISGHQPQSAELMAALVHDMTTAQIEDAQKRAKDWREANR